MATDSEAEKNHGHGHQAHNAMEDHIPAGHHELMFANMKEGFDEHRNHWTEQHHQNQSNRDADRDMARRHADESFTLRMKHAENTVETANLAGKAALRAVIQGTISREQIRAIALEILADVASERDGQTADE